MSPTGDTGDVQSGFINNLDMGAAFYDYAGSEARFDPDADFFFVRNRQAVPEPASPALVGLERRHWSTASPIRTIFRGAFPAAGLPYFNPHSGKADVGPRSPTSLGADGSAATTQHEASFGPP